MLMTTDYRNYEECNQDVIECYKHQRTNQTLDFVKYAIDKYCIFDRKDSFWNLFDKLKNFRDLSDPDINLTNHHHLFQTAEGLRKDGYPDWMQLVGLIHDLGKILYLKGNDDDGTSIKTQWAIVGDTYVVGCKIPDSITLPNFNSLNPDMNNSKYNTKYGTYHHGYGLNNVYCSFGHDEYLYRLLKFNRVYLPLDAFYMIRFHSFYLWHTENEYKHFETIIDSVMKRQVKIFNKYDLYTKANIETDEIKLREYYSKIVDKYLPKELWW
jgi:inositol oxygenase